MASEILSVPEEYLKEVIKIIRAGVKACNSGKSEVSAVVEHNLLQWCKDEEAYLRKLNS